MKFVNKKNTMSINLIKTMAETKIFQIFKLEYKIILLEKDLVKAYSKACAQ